MTQFCSWKLMRKVAVTLVAGVVVLTTGANVAGRSGNSNAGKIAFEGDSFGDWGLSAMRPDGSNLTNLEALSGAADASWSPNGKQVVFEADPNHDDNLEVFVMDADGSNLRNLTESAGRDYWADWFPNGQQIVFTSDRTGVPNIYVMNADGTDQRPLTDGTDYASYQPDVSPDGKQVVFIRETLTDPPTIWVMNADGSGPHALTLPGSGADIDPQWSPNGKSIVFSSDRGGTFEIYVMDADGDNVVQLTTSAGADFNPTFSPDGQQIAWWKLRSGQGDIWTMDRDGSNQVNITNSAAFEGFPDWHPGHLGKK
jgi:TolB protein